MIHHKIQEWFEKQGFIDRWSLWHFAQGSVFGFIFIQFFGVLESLAVNLFIAVLWEILEYRFDESYRYWYPIRNNTMDVLLSMVACLLVVA